MKKKITEKEMLKLLKDNKKWTTINLPIERPKNLERNPVTIKKNKFAGVKKV